MTGAPQGQPLTGYSLESLSNVLVTAGFQRYRAAQIFDWLYLKRARTFHEMKNISRRLEEYLAEYFVITSSTLAATHDAGDGASKLEIILDDGETVEAVVIKSQRRITVCLSSQVGCPLGCAFCATGAGGYVRNLHAHEIVEQALHAASVIPSSRISHVVFMGMGEPCLNLDSVFDAVRTLNSPYAFNIGARRITISTLGDPACIARIAQLPIDIGLAISLHAADDALRRRLLPSARATVSETVKAADEYFARTGREVTYEYVLLAGVNDSAAHAAKLAAVLSGRRAFVNLIAYNEVEGLEFRRPSERRIDGFRDRLEARGINVFVRDSRGSNAKAACGQLRLHKSKGAE